MRVRVASVAIIIQYNPQLHPTAKNLIIIWVGSASAKLLFSV